MLLLDVVVRGTDRLVLVDEGYMPAQNFHAEQGPVRMVALGGWRFIRPLGPAGKDVAPLQIRRA